VLAQVGRGVAGGFDLAGQFGEPAPDPAGRDRGRGVHRLVAEVYGELHNPYFDGAVLDAVVSVPAWRRFSARRYKPVLVDACGDLLPPAHRRRTTKGVFARDYHRGLRANLPRVLTLTDGRMAQDLQGCVLEM
jgi:hypothetical protein